VVAHKAGHALHTQLVTRLLADPTLWIETTVESERDAGSAAPVLRAVVPAPATD